MKNDVSESVSIGLRQFRNKRVDQILSIRVILNFGKTNKAVPQGKRD